LSNSDCDCVTTLLYEGGGCTSNAAIVLGGDAIIDASGTGALVLTTTVVGGTPEKTLTLTGPNSDGNTINGISGDGVSVVKDGTGLWRMNAATKQFDGTLTVTQGFIHMSNPAAVNDDTITIGDTSASSAGVAAYLLEQGVSRDAASGIEVLASSGSQVVYLGGANTSGSSTFRGEIRMDRDVTLVAATGGTVDFSSTWAGPTSGSLATRNVTIGAPGYAGTAEFFNFGDLETTGTVTIRYGTVVLGFDTNLISAALTLISDDGPVTLDLGGADLSQGNLFFTGSGNLLINTDNDSGELQIENGGSTATVTVSGTGHQITCDVSIDDNADFVISGDLEISGDISGAAGITKSGDGTLTLSGANTYTGTTTVSSGTLVLSGTLAATSQISIGTATLECSGSTKLADAVEITGTATQKGFMTVGTLSGSGSLTHDGGTLTLTNASTLTGTLTVAAGSLVLDAIVSGSGVESATLTSSSLTVDFSSPPSSGNQFVLLAGPTGGTYGTVTLTNAGGATGTYNSATSTLTID
jgi:autotransporter-associated beta strand protein